MYTYRAVSLQSKKYPQKHQQTTKESAIFFFLFFNFPTRESYILFRCVVDPSASFFPPRGPKCTPQTEEKSYPYLVLFPVFPKVTLVHLQPFSPFDIPSLSTAIVLFVPFMHSSSEAHTDRYWGRLGLGSKNPSPPTPRPSIMRNLNNFFVTYWIVKPKKTPKMVGEIALA